MNKLRLFPYNKKSKALFLKDKLKIEKALIKLRYFEIHHIGSSSVPDLGGKGIIDILVAIKDWNKRDDYIKELKRIGFRHVDYEERQRIFISRVGKTKYGDTHLHLVKIKNRQYKELLEFGNYLRRNKSEANRYFKLKLSWIKEAHGNRLEFGKRKAPYIKVMLSKLRKHKYL